MVQQSGDTLTAKTFDDLRSKRTQLGVFISSFASVLTGRLINTKLRMVYKVNQVRLKLQILTASYLPLSLLIVVVLVQVYVAVTYETYTI